MKFLWKTIKFVLLWAAIIFAVYYLFWIGVAIALAVAFGYSFFTGAGDAIGTAINPGYYHDHNGNRIYYD